MSTQSLAGPTVAARRRLQSGAGYVIRWLVGPVVTILTAAFLIFVTLSLSPGDPVSQLLGTKATEAQRQSLREQLGLDQSVLSQFGAWLGRAVQGNFGASYTYRQDVWNIIEPRLGTTMTLVGMSMVLILIIGLGMGVLGGVFSRLRPYVTAATGVMISVPSFVAASFLIGVFAVALGLFPTFGAGDVGIDRIWHLILPAVALSIAWGAYVAQLAVAAIGEERSREHVTTAVGRGLPFEQIVRKHILRNAGIPILTASGLTLASLVAGSVVVETAFGIDGIGALLAKSVLAKDQPVVVAISVIIVAVFVLMTTTVDVIQVMIDPQLRPQRGIR